MNVNSCNLFCHDSSRIRTCDPRIKSPLLYQLSYRVYTKSLRSKNFSNPLSSIARRCGTDKHQKSLNQLEIDFWRRVCTLRRMWDSNPRTTSLPPDGFQDRSLCRTWVILLDVFPKFQPRNSRLPHGKRAQFSSPTYEWVKGDCLTAMTCFR